MKRSRFYALLLGISLSCIASSADLRAQAVAASTSICQVSAAVTIIDGTSVGIRKSDQGVFELSMEANGLKTTVMTRSAGKLFQEQDAPTTDAETKEIVVAFE
jgi:hypothetical protein